MGALGRVVEESAGGGVEGGEEGDLGKGDAVGFDVVSAVRERLVSVLWIFSGGIGMVPLEKGVL